MLKGKPDTTHSSTNPKLALIDLEEEYMYHWEIEFEVKVDKKDLDMEAFELSEIAPVDSDDPFLWVSDALVVRSTKDGQCALAKARNYVMNTSHNGGYELPCKEFRLLSLKLISVAEI